MLYERLLMLAVITIFFFGSAGTFAGGKETCPEKSLFVNVSSERVRAVQVALLVTMANAAPEGFELQPGVYGQGAEVQLFFADAAAPYVLDLDQLSRKQKRRLNRYLRKEFGYGVKDIERLQTQTPMAEGLPGIFAMQEQFGVTTYGCSLCVMETLEAIGIDVKNPEAVTSYLIDGAQLMTANDFDDVYDRDCGTSAAVISY